jgi:hypothetical protein
MACAGCYQRGQAVQLRLDDAPLGAEWIIPPPGWMLRPESEDWPTEAVCSEPCLRKVASRESGVAVAAEMAIRAQAKRVWEIVTTARARDLSDLPLCEHCGEKPIDLSVSVGDDRRDWCSEECTYCCGTRCKHVKAHIARLHDEHHALCDEVDRLRRENSLLRGDLEPSGDERELETVAAEILALDERATTAPWGEKCGALKHYVFSKDPKEDFGASLQELHWNDGHIVPAHDNASLIAFYRNYAPRVARSWGALWHRAHRTRDQLEECKKVLVRAEEMISVMAEDLAQRMASSIPELRVDANIVNHVDGVVTRIRTILMEAFGLGVTSSRSDRRPEPYR